MTTAHPPSGTRARPRKRIVLFSQTFMPDPAAVGQHMTDVAVELARRGHEVLVYASSRGYENPSLRYLPRETFHGVQIRRLPFSSFGKKHILLRILGTFSFMCQCIFLALFTRRVAGIFFSTSPPLIGVAACAARIFRRVPIAYWAMDLNPDQLIAMGKIREKSFTSRTLEFVNCQVLRHSKVIIALDRFMAERLLRRGKFTDKIVIIPPWSHDDHLPPVDHEHNLFREKQGWAGKFVVMYSGNHSPANPLKTLLEAAVLLKNEPGLQFAFIGGGLGKREVEAYQREHQLAGLLSLPYQPLDQLSHSLGAADVHVVSLGDNMVGIVHPCKIYGAMSVGKPILFLGPQPSHVSEILDQHPIGWHVRHGDVEATVAALRAALATSVQERARMGDTARQVLQATLSQQRSCGKLCDRLETAFGVVP